MANIHPSAIVDPQAQLAASVSVGPYAVIGPHVRIDEGTTIGPHCVIEGHTTIGRDNQIFQFSSLGAAPQDKKYKGEPTRLVIGDRNTIREFCTFNTGTVQDKAETRIDFTRPAAEVHNHIRALSPFPGAWFELPIAGKAERVKVLGSNLTAGSGKSGTVLAADGIVVACGDDAVSLTRLQKAGGKPLEVADFLRGTAVVAGTVLS